MQGVGLLGLSLISQKGMAMPLRSLGDVHARGLWHVGDRLLPRKERLQCLDEELGGTSVDGLGLGLRI